MLKSLSRPKSRKRALACFEGLEPRQFLSTAPLASFSGTTFYFNDIESSASGGSSASPSQTLTIKNTGTAKLSIPANGITLGGTNASEFTINSKAAVDIAAGASKSFTLAFKASALGVQTASLTIKTNDTKHVSTTINLRGLGTAGTGGSLEPSLQRILDLFQIPDKVGLTNPASNDFPITPATPNDEVSLQRLMKAGTGPVTVSLLAVFDNFKTPATQVGYYTPGNPDATTQLFEVPNQNDAQSVHPTISGNTTFDPGTKSFGIYTTFPAFGFRNSYSEDNLNTWESNPKAMKKVRFYALKNPDGSKVANAYVFATEDWNVKYDFNDVVGIIRNVKLSTAAPPPPPSGGGDGGGGNTGPGSIGNIANLAVKNLDAVPSNDRMVFSRISHLDTVRPNVVHDKGTLELTNNGSSTITITSLTLGDGTDFKISAGGGSKITIAPGKSHDVTIQFVGAGTGSTIIKTFTTSLKITVGTTTDTVNLAGLWQSYSEQTPSHVYDEPSLPAVINTIFGYKTVIENPGQTTKHQGHPVPVGDEVISPYWQTADSGPVKVRLIAAWHRQNNFTTDGNHTPLTAASTFRFYYKGSPNSTNNLFTHNSNEGQSVLQHISNSTTQPAQGSFTPSSGKTFGFEVDSRYSDDSLNPLDFDPKTLKSIPDTGHAIRFFPLKDENGKLVPNTYIAAMDYTSNQWANYDYQDNIYIISNIKPAMTSTTTTTTMAMSSSAQPASLFGSTSVKDQTNILSDANAVLV